VAVDRLPQCTRGKLYLRGGTGGFKTGDNVEVDFDGTPRRITECTSDAIAISPPLDRKPLKCSLVANWGDNDDLRLDLRLKPDSPGARLGKDGGTVGSTLDVPAFRRGDFDGDGRRDLPSYPEDWGDGAREPR